VDKIILRMLTAFGVASLLLAVAFVWRGPEAPVLHAAPVTKDRADTPIRAIAEPFRLVEFDGLADVNVDLDDLRVKIWRSSASKDGDFFPVASGYAGGKLVFEMRLDENYNDNPISELSVLRLDPANSRLNIVFSSFWGGAHCCTMTKIASLVDGKWQVIQAETLDAGGYLFKDIDGDGVFELVSVDNSFYYAYSSYSASVAPIRLSRLTGDKIIDVTHSPQYQEYLREDLLSTEKAAQEQSELWRSNGFLAGWVASKALVNEFDDAWSRMLTLYDKDDDWSLSRCRVALVGYSCPAGEAFKVTFPEALRDHLSRAGYLR